MPCGPSGGALRLRYYSATEGPADESRGFPQLRSRPSPRVLRFQFQLLPLGVPVRGRPTQLTPLLDTREPQHREIEPEQELERLSKVVRPSAQLPLDL